MDVQKTTIANAIRTILQTTPHDLDTDALKRTPQRVAQVWVDLTAGYLENEDAIINGALYPTTDNHMVLVRNIRFSSLCEHHLMPFFGEAHVAYIPNGRVIGLSKIPRIVNMYARRLQIQERMTTQIAQLLYQKSNAQGVAVLTTAFHLCTLMRGVRNCSANLVSTMFLGKFREDVELRREFFDLISAPMFARSGFPGEASLK